MGQSRQSCCQLKRELRPKHVTCIANAGRVKPYHSLRPVTNPRFDDFNGRVALNQERNPVVPEPVHPAFADGQRLPSRMQTPAKHVVVAQRLSVLR